MPRQQPGRIIDQPVRENHHDVNALAIARTSPRSTRAIGECVHIVMVFPHGLVDDPTGLLAGNYDKRRMVYFSDMADVRAKAAALASIVNAWVRLEEEQG